MEDGSIVVDLSNLGAQHVIIFVVFSLLGHIWEEIYTGPVFTSTPWCYHNAGKNDCLGVFLILGGHPDS